MYRFAELARWRNFPKSGLLNKSLQHGWMFLVVEQTIQYKKQILPFSKFNIRTSISTTDNKWLHYKHIFEEFSPNNLSSPQVFAIIDCKAVLKEKSGKTIKIDAILKSSEFYESIISKEDSSKVY